MRITGYNPLFGWNNSSNMPTAALGGDLGGSLPNPTVTGLEGVAFSGTPAATDLIQFDGTNWVFVTPASIAPGLTVEDEGTPLATAATTLNFTGSGVTASGSGATKTINVPAGRTFTFFGG